VHEPQAKSPLVPATEGSTDEHPDSTGRQDRDASLASQFQREAESAAPGFVAEFWEFLRSNKKWWLTPIILAILLLTLFGLLGQSVLAPFLYPLF